MFCHISDHLPIFTLLLDQNKNLNKTSWLSFRNKSGNNVAKFKDRLANVHWDDYYLNVKILIVLIGVFLINTLPLIYNDCFPLKKVKVKNVTLSKPWITKGLLKSVRKKNLLHNCFLANPTPYREKLYKSYKNKSTPSRC